LSPLNITKGFRTIGIWPLNSAAIEGIMGPSTQFIPGLPDYNVDMRDPGFYNFSDSEEEGDQNAPKGSDWELHIDSDVDAEDGNNVAISANDPGLLSLQEERIFSS
jgi:hypothetical protein